MDGARKTSGTAAQILGRDHPVRDAVAHVLRGDGRQGETEVTGGEEWACQLAGDQDQIIVLDLDCPDQRPPDRDLCSFIKWTITQYPRAWLLPLTANHAIQAAAQSQGVALLSKPENADEIAAIVESFRMPDRSASNWGPTRLKPRIILVDDDDLVLYTTRVFLSKIAAVDCFGSANEALAKIREREYDILVTDLKMPEVEGTTLIEEAIRLQPKLLSIAMTGYPESGSMVAISRLGGFDYLLKPLEPSTFRTVVWKAWNLIRVRRQQAFLVGMLERSAVEHESNHHYVEGITACLEGIVITCDALGRIENLNSVALALFGYRKEQLIGAPLAVLFAAESLEKFPLPLEKARGFPPNGVIRHREIVAISGDGRCFSLDLNITIMCDVADRPSGFVLAGSSFFEEAPVTHGRGSNHTRH